MRKVKFRTVRELYGGTEDVLEPTKHSYQGSSGIEEQSSMHFTCSKFQKVEKSRTCGISATPCSLIATKPDKFSDDGCKGKTAHWCSFSDTDMLSPSLSSASNARQRSSSEISNVFSACSSHDSFSENAESKATLRTTDTSQDTEMLENTGPIIGESNFPKELIVGDQIYSKQLEKQKKLECLGDYISCISILDDTKMMVGDRCGAADMKNMLFDSASVDSFPAVEKVVNDQSACHFLASSHFDKVDTSHPRRPNFTKESSEAAVISASKSDQSEISSLRDFCSGGSLLKEEPSECSEEQVESSLTRVVNFTVVGPKQEVHNHAESVKADPEINVGCPVVEAAQCSEGKDRGESSNAVVEEPNIWEPPLQSQHVDYNDGSNILEDEVRVCDICGDAGREELLAICSKCSDGAEHIYCMHIRLEKVPGCDWMCEECMVGEHTEKQKQDKVQKETKILKASSLNGNIKNSTNGGAFRFRNGLELSLNGSGVEERRKNEANSSSHIAANKPEGNLDTVSVTNGTQDTNFKPSTASRTFSRSLIRGDSSFKNLDKMKIKPVHEVVSFGDQSFNNTRENACLPKMSGDKSLKLQPQTQLPQGSLLKSKSFNIMDSKVKGQLSKECSVQRKKFASDVATEDSSKEDRSRIMCKSLSFNNASSDRSNAADAKVKMLSSNISCVEDLKRLSHAKEENSSQGKYTSKLCNPTVSSPIANFGVCASTSEKEIVSRGETLLSGSNYHDLGAVQGHKQSYDSLKPTSHIPCKGLKYPNEEQNRVFDDVSLHVEHFLEAACAIKANNSNTTFASYGRPYLRESHWSTTTIPSRISAVPHLHYIWQGGFEVQRSGRLLSSCGGIQAHLSTYASSVVLEVVNKLPQKIILEEVPRMSTWPNQFSENHATEDNIALYFFAKDLESYGRNYKSLLESMIKNDLALKGNMDGVELLIFSSNLLPEKSQRWNKLLFLWGVFRGRKREERDAIMQEMDLKLCPRQIGEHSADYARVDEERECKRMKSCFGMYEYDGSGGTKYSGDGFPFHTSGLNPTFSGEDLRWVGAHDLSMSSKARQGFPTDGVDQSESGIPNLELSLGAQNKSKEQGVTPLFINIMDNKTNQDKLSKPVMDKEIDDDDDDDEEGVSVSLSLSLALPSPTRN